MTGTLAMMIRSLTIDARLLRTHLFRLMFVVFTFTLLLSAQQTLFAFGAPGLRFFGSISYLNFFMIVLAGVSFFATTITEEKEEGTLGLLRMAGVNPLAVLLGKLAPRLISAILLLSIQYPFTLLAVTLGGVTWRQVFATYCSLLAHLLMLAAVGLFVSVISRRSSSASWKMAILAFFLYILFPWMQMVVPLRGAMQFASPILDAIQSISALTRIQTILMTGFADSAFSFQFYSNLAVAGIFFGLSWLAFERFARDDQTATAPLRSMLFNKSSPGKRLAPGNAWHNALLWKDFHFITGGPFALLAKLILYPLMVFFFGCCLTTGSRNWTDPEVLGTWFMSLTFVAFLVEISWCAANVFHSEIKWNTLSSIMLLPLSTPQVVYSKVAGCLISLLPSVSLFGVGALIYPDGMINLIEDFLSEPSGWCTILLIGLFVHLVAFLSLFVKWGALALAIAILFVAFMFFQVCVSFIFFSQGISGMDWDTVNLIVAGLEFAGIIAFQVAIGFRLRSVAAK